MKNERGMVAHGGRAWWAEAGRSQVLGDSALKKKFYFIDRKKN